MKRAPSEPAKRKSANSKPKGKDQPDQLRGWKQISEFLGMPLSTAQRWAKSGMPINREGRVVTAFPEQLNRWLDREVGVTPDVHIATEDADLSSELRRAVSQVRARKRKS
jgi:phage terminase Nu1 subunit (DNA packaging protein)